MFGIIGYSRLSSQLERIEKRLEKIENEMEKLQRLDNHINFVETVFGVMKQPFKYILQLYYRGTSEEELKQIDSVFKTIC